MTLKTKRLYSTPGGGAAIYCPWGPGFPSAVLDVGGFPPRDTDENAFLHLSGWRGRTTKTHACSKKKWIFSPPPPPLPSGN